MVRSSILPRRHPGRDDRLHGVDDLGPAAVVEGHDQGHGLVVAVSPVASSIRLTIQRGTRQSRRPMKRIRTPIRCSSSRRRVSSWSAMTLSRKRTSSCGRRQFSVEKAYTVKYGMPEIEGAAGGVEEGVLAGPVALGAGQTLLGGPPAVAVHHARHVARNAVGVEAVKLHTCKLPPANPGLADRGRQWAGCRGRRGRRERRGQPRTAWARAAAASNHPVARGDPVACTCARSRHSCRPGGRHPGCPSTRTGRRRRRWRRRWPGPSASSATWWSRPVPAPARAWPTWSRPWSSAPGWWCPPPPRPSRISWPPGTSRTWPEPSACRSSSRSSRAGPTTSVASGSRRWPAATNSSGSPRRRRGRQRRRRADRGSGQPGLGPLGREIRRLVEWAGRATTGDRAELAWEPSPTAWAQVSVGARDCPGASRCPSGSVCFAGGGPGAGRPGRRGRRQHPPLRRRRWPPAASCCPRTTWSSSTRPTSWRTSRRRLSASRSGRPLPGPGPQRPARSWTTSAAAAAVEDAGAPARAKRCARTAGPCCPRPSTTPTRRAPRRWPASGSSDCRPSVRRAHRTRSGRPGEHGDSADGAEAGLRARHLRAQQAAGHLLRRPGPGPRAVRTARWRGSRAPTTRPVLRVAPLDVGAAFRDRLWGREDAPTAVMTSATIPPRLGERLGLPPGSYDVLDVGSPFAYDEQALLYCPVHLPDPRARRVRAGHARGAGRAHRGGRGPDAGPVHQLAGHDGRRRRPARRGSAGRCSTQSDLPKPALVARFSADEHSCLFATMGFWQGVDVPGPALSLVAIDRLPFPRPDDRLLQARRASSGPRRLRPDRRAPGGHPPGPGTGPTDPLPLRPRRGGGARPPPGQGPLPLGSDPGPAADAPHPTAFRRRSLPRPLRSGAGPRRVPSRQRPEHSCDQ